MTRLISLCVAFAFAVSCSHAEAGTVLLLSTGNSTTNNAIESALEGFGHTVDVGPQYVSFDAAAAAVLPNYDAVILAPNHNWPAGDMPSDGQTALSLFVNAGGGGLITSEWFVWKMGAQNVFNVLEPSIPVLPNGTYRTIFGGNIMYAVETADPILNAGLPSSFSFPANNIGGSETVLTPRPGATVFYDSDYNGIGPAQGAEGVVGWDAGAGRVISFSTLMSNVEIADPEYARLVSNAVDWVTNAPIAPVPEASTIVVWSVLISLIGGATFLRRTGKPPTE